MHWSIKIITATTLLGIGCNSAPNACVEVSSNTVVIGSPIQISDCSEYVFDNVINLGNGAKFNNQSDVTYTYFQGGLYKVELTAFSKKGNKSASAKEAVRVTYPRASEIQGNWTLIKVETREQLVVDPNVSLFDLPIDSTRSFNEQYEITEDSLFVTHDNDEFYIFQFSNSCNYDNGTLQINQNYFPIIKFTSSEMILRGPYFKGFELLYLKR